MYTDGMKIFLVIITAPFWFVPYVLIKGFDFIDKEDPNVDAFERRNHYDDMRSLAIVVLAIIGMGIMLLIALS